MPSQVSCTRLQQNPNLLAIGFLGFSQYLQYSAVLDDIWGSTLILSSSFLGEVSPVYTRRRLSCFCNKVFIFLLPREEKQRFLQCQKMQHIRRCSGPLRSQKGLSLFLGRKILKGVSDVGLAAFSTSMVAQRGALGNSVTTVNICLFPFFSSLV